MDVPKEILSVIDLEARGGVRVRDCVESAFEDAVSFMQGYTGKSTSREWVNRA